MNLPNIKIGDYIYSIEMVSSLKDEKTGEPLWGNCDNDECVIKLVPHKRIENTLRHEITHAINYVFSAKLSEEQVDQVSTGWNMVHRDNICLNGILGGLDGLCEEGDNIPVTE